MCNSTVVSTANNPIITETNTMTNSTDTKTTVCSSCYYGCAPLGMPCMCKEQAALEAKGINTQESTLLDLRDEEAVLLSNMNGYCETHPAYHEYNDMLNNVRTSIDIHLENIEMDADHQSIGHMLDVRNQHEVDMTYMDVDTAKFMHMENQLERMDKAIEIEIGKLQEAEAEEAKMDRDVQEFSHANDVTIRILIKQDYMELMAGEYIQVIVNIPGEDEDFGADSVELKLNALLDSNLVWDAFSMSGMWVCSSKLQNGLTNLPF